MRSLVIIGLGGAIGSIGRYLVQLGISRYVTVVFPLGTFLVNITGCFLIGLLYSEAEKHATLPMEWRLFLITGICGGYTTFSSYSLEAIALLRQGNYTYFFLYIAGSVVLGLLATAGGILVAR